MIVGNTHSTCPAFSCGKSQYKKSNSVLPSSERKGSGHSVLNDISSRYDVRNMSAPEMRKMAQELYDNHIIGLKEMGVLVLLPLEAVQTECGLSFRPLDSDTQKFDYISNIEGAISFAKTRGEKGTEYLEKALSILKSIEAARKHAINVSA